MGSGVEVPVNVLRRFQSGVSAGVAAAREGLHALTSAVRRSQTPTPADVEPLSTDPHGPTVGGDQKPPPPPVTSVVR
jgi:hypothetical protein